MPELFDGPADPKIATAPPDAKKKGEYRDRGAYFTPDLLAQRCCEALSTAIPPPRTILEPGCGGGAFLRAARAAWPTADLLGIDLLPCCDGPGRIQTLDLFFNAADPALRGPFDLVLGNPPFTMAEEFIHRGLGLVETGGHVAFLLRIALIAGVRKMIYPANPPFRVYPVAPRPSFTGGGSDRAQEYALVVWRKGYRGDFSGARLLWKEPR